MPRIFRKFGRIQRLVVTVAALFQEAEKKYTVVAELKSFLGRLPRIQIVLCAKQKLS